MQALVRAAHYVSDSEEPPSMPNSSCSKSMHYCVMKTCHIASQLTTDVKLLSVKCMRQYFHAHTEITTLL